MKPQEKKLLKLYSKLPEEQRTTVLQFVEFLLQRNASDLNSKTNTIAEPLPIPRPPQESVVAAIKRLSASYPMLEKDKLLNDTSMLVSQHVIQGRDVIAVIDELELVFQRHYQALLNNND
jgi:hypothetical protein